MKTRSVGIASVALALVALAALVSVRPASACMCGKNPPPVEAFRKADAVFVGTVMEARPVKHHSVVMPLSPKGDSKWRLDEQEHLVRVFRIDEPLKGVAGSAVELLTDSDQSSCSIDLEVGSQYLVYAYYWKPSPESGAKPEEPEDGLGIQGRTYTASAYVVTSSSLGKADDRPVPDSGDIRIVLDRER